MDFRFNFVYTADGVLKTTSQKDNEDFTMDVSEKNGVITAELNTRRIISFSKFEMTADFPINNAMRLFVNGYQSWTDSREYAPNSSMDGFNPRFAGVEKKKFNPLGIWGAGDLTFHQYPEETGIFYGYSYAYARQGSSITLFGSLSERAGYTIITFNSKENTVTLEKDLQGVDYNAGTQLTLLSLAVIADEYDKAFDKYFALMNIPAPRVDRKCGYTTWYNYYTNVTEEIVNRDLAAISKLDTKIDIFQIDDGYESTVGDWLIIDEKKFPSGMKAVADSIHNNDMLAGLWLAPFAATAKSRIYKEHKDWFVKNNDGKIKYASQNWGGFFALDIYNPDARAYIADVFDTVLNVWGYDMVKLDFLYACCIVPIHNKSRGEIMCDAMDFLRECCGDKIILGCGVPLAPAFGKVDFCRIGCDVALSWDKKPFSREDVSTQNTLLNTIFRRHLDGRAFLNDPDVFLLRDNNLDMPMSQRKIVSLVNSLCGNLLFVSDDVSTYTDEQKRIFTETVTRPKAKILDASINQAKDIVIEYELDGTASSLRFNLANGTMKSN